MLGLVSYACDATNEMRLIFRPHLFGKIKMASLQYKQKLLKTKKQIEGGCSDLVYSLFCSNAWKCFSKLPQ